MARKRIFTETTPLGYRVVLTRDRWREIIRFKHPALAGCEAEVRACVRDPEAIRGSQKDPDVQLYYRTYARGFVCVVVCPSQNEERFVVTAYFTKTIKKGQELWIK